MEPRGQVVKAMAVIQRRRDGALLVAEEANPSGALFHRPLGGRVEFGEYAVDAVRREFREEIGQALTRVRPAGVLENIFEWNGATQHEIVFVFTAALADEAAYEIPEQVIRDARGKTRVIWRLPDTASLPLYPVGVADVTVGAIMGANQTHDLPSLTQEIFDPASHSPSLPGRTLARGAAGPSHGSGSPALPRRSRWWRIRRASSRAWPGCGPVRAAPLVRCRPR